MKSDQSKVLVVDDNEDNRIVLSRRLERQGLAVNAAEHGLQALDMLQSQAYDLILLDIMMPEMNGYQVLEHLKADNELRHIPVIVISAVGDFDSVIRCIELGAEDYLMKPFNKVLLEARIGASLEKKHLRDQEQAFLEQIKEEQEKSDRLLLNILPAPIADRLKQNQSTIADRYEDVSVLFADIVDFTHHTARMGPGEIVKLLDRIFLVFDDIATAYQLEKIKTIGDSYMCVGGLPSLIENHTAAIAAMALDLQEVIKTYGVGEDKPFQLRIGIHCGPVVAGVIGTNKFIYDLWGDTVNIASRMESHSLPGHIQTTQKVYDRLKDSFQFTQRGAIPIKGKGEMMTYFLRDRLC